MKKMLLTLAVIGAVTLDSFAQTTASLNHGTDGTAPGLQTLKRDYINIDHETSNSFI